jgi:hypothetical protein
MALCVGRVGTRVVSPRGLGVAPTMSSAAWCLGGGLLPRVPTGEYKHRRVTLESTGQNLCPFYPQANPIVFNGGKRRLRDAGQLRKLILAQLLQVTKYADRLSHRHLYTTLGSTKPARITPSYKYPSCAWILATQKRPEQSLQVDSVRQHRATLNRC